MRYHALDEGTVSVQHFAVSHGVQIYVLKDHIANGIGDDRIEVTEVPHGEDSIRRWLTPDQQRAALAFWDKHGIPYRKKVEAKS